jgi:protein TonB
MFQTLERTWDTSARRGWTTAASLSIQALAVSLLLLVPLLTIQGPPRLAWFDPHLLAPPPAPPAPTPMPVGGRQSLHPSNMYGIDIVTPPSIPSRITPINDLGVIPAPDISQIGVIGSTGEGGRNVGVPGGLREGFGPAPPPPPTVSARPLRVSHWAEGNLIYRVQPAYPQLARQARIQGTVELRAIISKLGTIENLTVVSGHAMLAGAAVEAVKQWRYRPYLLNGDPIEVETDITVNFKLDGN